MPRHLRHVVSGTRPSTGALPRRVRTGRAAPLLAAALLSVGSPAGAQRAPAPTPVNLPPEVVSLACAPTLTFEEPASPLRVTGSQEAVLHRTLAPGDLITINAGSKDGIEVGREYYTRRAMPIERRRIGRDNPATIRTSGWIRVYAVEERMSLATVTYACDAVHLDDYLDPFVLPTVPVPSAERLPAQRGNYGRVVIGSDNRTSLATGDYFVVDRGSDHGVSVGAQFVVYRDKRLKGDFLFEIGEAVAVDVKADTSTLRITYARDAFKSGDLVALRK